MAEDRDPDAPSLEPPSLFGRKRKKPAKAAPAPEPAAETPTELEAEPAAEPVAETPTELAAEPVAPVAEPIVDDVPTAVVPPVVPPPAEPDPTPVTIFDDTSVPTPEPEPRLAPTVAREPRPPREPWLAGRPAAALTGLLVGALIVAATAGGLGLCTKVKGTSSCGGSGFFLDVAILVVAVLVGAFLLRTAAVPEPGSTSFLAVGLLSVVILLFLVGSIFQWWMAIVIPLVSVATFLLSHWVTTYIDPANQG